MAPDQDPGLPTTVKGLALVSLLNDFASEMVYPLLPAFITTTLGAGPMALGVLDGAADLTAATLRWWSGRLADRRGVRGPLILVGYALAVVFRPIVSLTTAAWQVVTVRVLDRVGKGLRSPARDALIADVTPASIHGRAFGLHRTADHLGAVLGSLAAFELLRRGFPVRRVLGWSIVPGLAALAVLAAVLWIARGRGDEGREPAPTAEAAVVPSGPLAWLALLAAIRLPETLLLLRLQDQALPMVAVPLVWALLHVVKSAASYPSGLVVDRLGSVPALALGSLAYAGSVLALGRPLSPGMAIAVFMAHGLAAGVVEPAERVAVARVAGGKRGRAFGAYQSMAGIGALVTGLGYGWLYQARGGGVCLMVAAFGCIAASGAWLLTVRRRNPGTSA